MEEKGVGRGVWWELGKSYLLEYLLLIPCWIIKIKQTSATIYRQDHSSLKFLDQALDKDISSTKLLVEHKGNGISGSGEKS